jgi:hypothetical protein
VDAIVRKQLGAMDPLTKKPHVRRRHTVTLRCLKVAAAVRRIPMDTFRSHREYFRRVESRATTSRQDQSLADHIIQGIRMYAAVENPWIALDLSEHLVDRPVPDLNPEDSGSWLAIGRAFFDNFSKVFHLAQDIHLIASRPKSRLRWPAIGQAAFGPQTQELFDGHWRKGIGKSRRYGRESI